MDSVGDVSGHPTNGGGGASGAGMGMENRRVGRGMRSAPASVSGDGDLEAQSQIGGGWESRYVPVYQCFLSIFVGPRRHILSLSS